MFDTIQSLTALPGSIADSTRALGKRVTSGAGSFLSLLSERSGTATQGAGTANQDSRSEGALPEFSGRGKIVELAKAVLSKAGLDEQGEIEVSHDGLDGVEVKVDGERRTDLEKVLQDELGFLNAFVSEAKAFEEAHPEANRFQIHFDTLESLQADWLA